MTRKHVFHGMLFEQFGLVTLILALCAGCSRPSTTATETAPGSGTKGLGTSQGASVSTDAKPESSSTAASQTPAVTERPGQAMRKLNVSDPQSLADLETFIFDISLALRDSVHKNDSHVVVSETRKSKDRLRRIAEARDEIAKQISAVTISEEPDNRSLTGERSNLLKANRGLARMCRAILAMKDDDDTIKASLEGYQAGFKQYRAARAASPDYWDQDPRTPVLNEGPAPFLQGSEIVTHAASQGGVPNPNDLERQAKAYTARVQQLNDEADRIKAELAVFLRSAQRTGVLDKKKLDGYTKRLQAVMRELEALAH